MHDAVSGAQGGAEGGVEIRVPKLNSNDTSYTLVEWLVAPGARVSAGDDVVTVETAKASEDLTSDSDGVLHPLRPAGAECGAGEVIGLLFADEPARQRFIASAAATSTVDSPPSLPGQVITEPARRRMAELGLDLAAVQALDRKVVRTADIEALVRSVPATPAPVIGSTTPVAVPVENGQRLVPLTAVQRAVAAVVTESHRAVPAAFVAVKVRIDAAMAYGQELTKRHRCLIGPPELLIKALGVLRSDFPLCFAAPVDAELVRLADRVDVGVTIDVGKGLHVPVIRDVAAQPLPAVAKALMGFRMTAMRGSFRAGDLTGANIVLALHTDDDVTLAVPVVLPGTVCALSLAGHQRELDLDDATPGDPAAGGSPALVRRTVVQVGLAYDHRVINGREAVDLLVALRELLEHPERIPIVT